MKVYLFDTASGVYQGEDFLDPTEFDEAEGATNQAPPPPEPGKIPVYDQATAAWKLVAATILRKNGDCHD